jgi:hypothetical protein
MQEILGARGQQIQTAAEILNGDKVSGWSRALLDAMQQLREGGG